MATQWIQLSSGVMVPLGIELRANRRWTVAPIDLAKNAEIVRRLYSQEGIRISPLSGLARILDAADLLLKQYRANPESTDWVLEWKVFHLERIAKSVVPLNGHPNIREYLTVLTSGSLDFMQRENSRAKDRLFELEVWRTLNTTGQHAYLKEPDVVLAVGQNEVGIACKKICSERGTSKVLSNAVSQIRRSLAEPGVIALNVDNLTPGESILRVATFAQASDLLSKQCHDFMARAQRHLLKYFDRSEIIGAITSCSAIVETTREEPDFSNMQQWYLWTVPKLDRRGLAVAEQIRNLLGCE